MGFCFFYIKHKNISTFEMDQGLLQVVVATAWWANYKTERERNSYFVFDCVKTEVWSYRLPRGPVQGSTQSSRGQSGPEGHGAIP